MYRGARLASLQGAYVYGDFCSGKVWALRFDGSRVTDRAECGRKKEIRTKLRTSRSGPGAGRHRPGAIAAFGEDRQGELYVLSFDRSLYVIAAGQ